MISLQFLWGTALSSDVISWFEAGGPSHVDAVLPDGRLLGAQAAEIGGVPAGVQIRAADYFGNGKALRVDMVADSAMTSLFYGMLQEEVGKPYDMSGLITNFLIERNWRDPDAWWCSELQGDKLEKCGWFPYALATPSNRLTPEGLLNAISARAKVEIPA